jgi:hypothetical protein
MVKPYHYVPGCRKCCKKPEQSFRSKLKNALLDELELPVPENDEEIRDDPYLLLGYGCNAYYDVLRAV